MRLHLLILLALSFYVSYCWSMHGNFTQEVPGEFLNPDAKVNRIMSSVSRTLVRDIEPLGKVHLVVETLQKNGIQLYDYEIATLQLHIFSMSSPIANDRTRAQDRFFIRDIIRDCIVSRC